jgi:hypothetical protein
MCFCGDGTGGQLALQAAQEPHSDPRFKQFQWFLPAARASAFQPGMDQGLIDFATKCADKSRPSIMRFESSHLYI